MKPISKVLIDQDGGIDDALALILALRSPEIQVMGITAVSGNVAVEQAAINALRVVEVLDRTNVWVARGAAGPLSRKPIRAYSFHGNDGLGDSNLPLPKLQTTVETATNKITETVLSSKRHSVTLICTGPLTNAALLVSNSPDATRMLREIVIMGGAYGITEYGFGNETPVAEFNIYSDPEAAKIVFDAGLTVRAVGLDVTTIPRLELVKRDYARIAKKSDPVSQFAARILENNLRRHGRFTLHDPMAVAVKVWPALYRFANYPVEIETRGQFTTGMTIADRRLGRLGKEIARTVSVCEDVDPRFKERFLKRLMAV